MVANSSFNHNANIGLKIITGGAVTLTAVSASQSPTGRGSLIDCQGGLTVTNSSFNDNLGESGLSVPARANLLLQNTLLNNNNFSGLEVYDFKGNIDLENVSALRMGFREPSWMPAIWTAPLSFAQTPPPAMSPWPAAPFPETTLHPQRRPGRVG